MQFIDPRSPVKVQSAIPYGMNYYRFGSLRNDLLASDVWPGINNYPPDISLAASSNQNTLGLGSKQFSYGGQQPKIEVGDTIRIDSYSYIVKGYMLGVVTSYSHAPGPNISTISVDVYQFGGEGVSSQWEIRQQLYGGINVEQSTGSPHLAKLSVWAEYQIPNSYFGFPVGGEQTNVQTVNTDAQQAGYTKNTYQGRVAIIEDISEYHKPWLNTNVTATAEFRTTTIVATWTYPPTPGTPTYNEVVTHESENVSHSHTFTDADFSPDSPGWSPGIGAAPSLCDNYTESILGEYTSTYVVNNAVIYPDIDPNAWYPINSTTVLKEMIGSKITDVQPAGFFTPPGM
jgi:hypothetical protein